MSLQSPVTKCLSDLETRICALFPRSVSVAATDPTQPRPAAFPQEAAHLPQMREARRHEFLAGRAALHRAIAGLGWAPQPIPIRADRAPDLPVGICASLSHSRTLCVAVADRLETTVGLGLDLEPATPLDRGLWPTVCTRAERGWLAAQPEAERGVLAKQIFCAKEAAYKCQYALTGVLLDFDAFEITFADGKRFFATIRQPVASFTVGDRIHGRMDRVADHIVTATRIPA